MLWPARIAGHDFEDGRGGIQCISCGRKWMDIRTVSESDVGTAGIAHLGRLYGEEYVEIHAQKEREERALQVASTGLW